MTAATYTISFEADSSEFPNGGGDFIGTLVGFRDKGVALRQARHLIGVRAGVLRLDSSFNAAGATPDVPDTASVIKAWVHTYVDGELVPGSQEVRG